VTDVVFCDFTLPDTTAASIRECMSDCLREPGHDDRHVVGLAQNGWCLLYEVDADGGKLDRIVHVQTDGTFGREEMAAMLVPMDLARAKLT
jgi:hypothetical protein